MHLTWGKHTSDTFMSSNDLVTHLTHKNELDPKFDLKRPTHNSFLLLAKADISEIVTPPSKKRNTNFNL